MIPQLHSELRKMSTSRQIPLILLASAALTLLGAFIEGSSATVVELAHEDHQRNLLGAGSAAVFFATLAGIITVTSEYRYGTIHPTLLFEPRRRIVMGSKVAIAALAGIVFGTVCVGLSIAVGRVILATRDVPLALTTRETIVLAVGTVAATALGAMLGVAVGTLIRNQVGAIVAVVAYAFVVDSLLFAAFPSVGRYLPGKAGDALAGRGVEHLLTPSLGAGVLVIWALLLVTAAMVRDVRSDV
jgi:ABC-2 type transport system permease protein